MSTGHLICLPESLTADITNQTPYLSLMGPSCPNTMSQAATALRSELVHLSSLACSLELGLGLHEVGAIMAE